MKTHLVPFRPDMVRAIQNVRPNVWPAEPFDRLAPWKCETRRLPRHQPTSQVVGQGMYWAFDGIPALSWPDGGRPAAQITHRLAPYQVGDTLLVKEALMEVDGVACYQADANRAVTGAWPWKPRKLAAMYCPKRDVRYKLLVKSVRLVQLQDFFGPGDAISEGIYIEPPAGAIPGLQPRPEGFDTWTAQRRDQWLETTARAIYMTQCEHEAAMVKAYADLWDSINGKTHAWASNPWVWVYAFMRLE
jgi:hypothetical protein